MPEASRILHRAMDVARSLGFDCVAPEHLLIACLESPSTRLQTLLDRVGIERAALRESILARARRGSDTVPMCQLPITLSVKRALDASLEEAQAMGEQHLDVAHVVVGLLVDEGLAGESLRRAGMRLDFACVELARTREQEDGSAEGATHE